jgi:hypothetical protein
MNSKFVFHKKKVYKYSIELSSLTRIEKFDLYRNGVNGIWKRFSFDRENCSLSIFAGPRLNIEI